MPTPEQQQEYIRVRTEAVATANHPYDPLISVYGANGNMPDIHYEHPEEYNDITINLDEMIDGMEFSGEKEKEDYRKKIHTELDETMISAIVLGSCMSPDRLRDKMSDSSTVGDMTGANQMRLTSDVMNKDERAGENFFMGLTHQAAGCIFPMLRR